MHVNKSAKLFSIMDIYSPNKGSQYKVERAFTDFYENQFNDGELLTFVELHFLPYHGGYTVAFQEKSLYLYEEENSNILRSLGDYLRHVKTKKSSTLR